MGRSRRVMQKRGWVLAALALIWVLVACGNPAGSGPAATPDPTAASDSAFPVSVKHKFGMTTVPAAPQKVISLGITEQDSLLALGIRPIAVRDWGKDAYSGEYVWNEALFGTAKPTHLTGDELNFEQIAGLSPDLIVATQSGITKADYEKLSAIAPVVAQTADFDDYAMPMEDQLRLIGQAVGRSQKAEEVISGIQAELSQVKSAYPSFAGKSIVAVNPYFDEGQLMPYGKQSRLAEVLDQLGFSYSDQFKGGDQVPTSYERIDLLDQDVLLWLTGGDPQSKHLIEDLPGYKNLDVVKNGDDVFVDDHDAAWAFFVNSALSLPYFIDKLSPMLAEVTQ